MSQNDPIASENQNIYRTMSPVIDVLSDDDEYAMELHCCGIKMNGRIYTKFGFIERRHVFIGTILFFIAILCFSLVGYGLTQLNSKNIRENKQCETTLHLANITNKDNNFVYYAYGNTTCTTEVNKINKMLNIGDKTVLHVDIYKRCFNNFCCMGEKSIHNLTLELVSCGIIFCFSTLVFLYFCKFVILKLIDKFSYYQ